MTPSFGLRWIGPATFSCLQSRPVDNNRTPQPSHSQSRGSPETIEANEDFRFVHPASEREDVVLCAAWQILSLQQARLLPTQCNEFMVEVQERIAIALLRFDIAGAIPAQWQPGFATGKPASLRVIPTQGCPLGIATDVKSVHEFFEGVLDPLRWNLHLLGAHLIPGEQKRRPSNGHLTASQEYVPEPDRPCWRRCLSWPPITKSGQAPCGRALK